VELAGGEENLISVAKQAMEEGDYRWAAELLNYQVFAKPDNDVGRFLLADAYEQLGYQSESGPWRNFYLSGAKELRRGVSVPTRARTMSKDLVASVPTEMFLDFLGVRFNPENADDLDITLNLRFTDTGENFVLKLKNSVLNNISDKLDDNPNAEMIMTREVFDLIALKDTSMPMEIAKGNIKIRGNPLAVLNVFRRLDNYDPLFNIVTP
jgi:alkyl sulfatase BDS1-like metallo-beta-lactamase superfamily hydrolase